MIKIFKIKNNLLLKLEILLYILDVVHIVDF